MVTQMNNYFGTALAVALGGCLAACASAPRSALTTPLEGRPQQASAQQARTDATLPVAQAGTATDQVCASIPAAEQNVCPLTRTAFLGARELRSPLDPK